MTVALAAWRKVKTADSAAAANPYHEKAIRVMLCSLIHLEIAEADRRKALLDELAPTGAAAGGVAAAEWGAQ